MNSTLGRTRPATPILVGLTADDSACIKARLDVFAEYFSTIGAKVARSGDASRMSPGPQSLAHVLGPIRQSDLTFAFINPYSLPTICKRMKLSYSRSASSVPSKVIASSIECLSVPIAFLFNLSLNTGSYPPQFKHSSVIPIYKGKGAKADPANYRPISLSPFLSKLFEKALLTRLNHDSVTSNLLSPHQHGFRQGFSTDTALCEISQFIVTSFDEGYLVIGVFLDLTKAFDSLDHTILLRVLHHYGMDARSIAWTESYLRERVLSVSQGNLLSRQCPISHGVPQGSVLGPLLFLFFIDVILVHVNSLSDNLRAVAFADDTTLLFRLNKREPDLSSDLSSINSALLRVAEAFDALHLSVNPTKTQAILFRPRGVPRDFALPTNIFWQHVPLSLVDHVTCLGVTFDCSLSWKPHVIRMRSKLNSIVFHLHRLRRMGYPRSLLLVIFKLLFNSSLTYGVAVWGTCTPNVRKPLQTAQNHALRAVHGLPRRSPARLLYRRCNILDLQASINYRWATLAFLAGRASLPPSLVLGRLRFPSSRRRNSLDLVPPDFKTGADRLSPLVCLAATWNSLPYGIKASPTYPSFKKLLKQYLSI